MRDLPRDPNTSDAGSALLRGLGAVPLQLSEGGETAAHYGSVEAEHDALLEGVGLLVRNWHDHLRIHGEDRKAFLNGKVSCDLDVLAPDQGAYGFILDAKGHIQADATIRVFEDAIWLELPSGRGPFIGEFLSRFIVIDRVEMEPLNGLIPLTLIGPQARPMLASLPEAVRLPDRPWDLCRSIVWEGREVLVSADGRWGLPALTLWPTAPRAEALVGHLLDVGRSHGARLVGYQAVDRARIEAGIPWFGRDFAEANLPQETGQDGAVSYTKGCYLGQEVVARLHYRGQVSKILCRLTLKVNEVPESGAALALEGRRAGTLTSAVRSPRLGSVAGIALLQRRAAEKGVHLDVEGGGTAEVVGSPLTA